MRLFQVSSKDVKELFSDIKLFEFKLNSFELISAGLQQRIQIVKSNGCIHKGKIKLNSKK